MAKLLSIIILVLAIVLFPPATLAVISNNAVPGDATYPIKRALEDGIYAVASLNPTTKAWFAAARSDRRFKEVTVLATSGKKATETLNELVEQTQIAANQLSGVTDPVEKEKLKQQLVDSIKKYDLGLKQIESDRSNGQPIAEEPTQAENTQPSVPQAPPSATALPQETSEPRSSGRPLATASPLPPNFPTHSPIITPTPAPTRASPTPAPTIIPTLRPTPIPTVRPTPTPIPTNRGRQTSCDTIADEFQRARCRLGQIQTGLGAQSQEKKEQKESSNLTPKTDTGKLKQEKH